MNIALLDEFFLAGTDIDATYMFNSYRLSYRCQWVQNPQLQSFAGIAFKVCDANIGLKGLPEQEAIKTNLGVVPLINFYLHWQPPTVWALCSMPMRWLPGKAVPRMCLLPPPLS